MSTQDDLDLTTLSPRQQKHIAQINSSRRTNTDSARYFSKLDALASDLPDFPWVTLRLAIAHILLEDVSGALELFKKAQELISTRPDETFNSYVKDLEELAQV